MTDPIPTLRVQPETTRLARPGNSGAFSLIEVVFSIAIFSFSMLTVVGLIGTGLGSVDDSTRNTATASIQRLVRANIQATSYASIATMGTTPSYFTSAGYPTVQNPASEIDRPYYSMQYTTTAPNHSVVSSASGKVIQASLVYPYPANVHTNTFSIFVAP